MAKARTNIRVRFAPSPTGPLHIGGLRTALFNFLFALRHKGTFILRIEDTDQSRYVKGSEAYIQDTLKWCGMLPNEGPLQGGKKGPYRQSERKALYQAHVNSLVGKGAAYYAFDTPEELEALRESLRQSGAHHQHYNAQTRQRMCNALTLSDKETKERLARKTPYVVRLKVANKGNILCKDLIRGHIQIHSSTLEDKVLLKADGMPTYHLANVVDDYHMGITHVIRGEEWLPSLPYHVLLYEAFGWGEPKFAHLPLILNPNTKGKLSKRNALKHDYPIFPLQWTEDGQTIDGFKEKGFLPEALLNYLALLGWTHPQQQEAFIPNPNAKDKQMEVLRALAKDFALEDISAVGTEYDLSKAEWLNAKHLHSYKPEKKVRLLKEYYPAECAKYKYEWLIDAWELLEERPKTLLDILLQAEFHATLNGEKAKEVKQNLEPETRKGIKKFKFS